MASCRGKRGELYAARKAMTYELRREAARAIGVVLDDRCDDHRPTLVGHYWPIKCQPDLLQWAQASRYITILLAGCRLPGASLRILALGAG